MCVTYIVSVFWCSIFQELGEWLHIGPLQSRTHIWSADTMVSYLSFLGEELRERRRKLNLPHSARALIICDHATQHTAKRFQQLKEE